MIKAHHIRSFLFIICVMIYIMDLPLYANSNERVIIEQLHVDNEPYRIRMKLSHEPIYKIIRIDPKELLIAFQNVRVDEVFRQSGKGLPFIREVAVTQLQGNVITVLVSTNQDIDNISARWVYGNKTFLIDLTGKNSPVRIVQKTSPTSQPPIKQNQGQYNTQNSYKTIAKKPTTKASPKKSLPKVTLKDKKDLVQDDKVTKVSYPDGFSGNIDDFIQELKYDRCYIKKEMQSGFEFCNKGLWDKAFDIFDEYIELNERNSCLELAYFLRAYCLYKMSGDNIKDLDSASLFQEAISYYPDSKYIPYAWSALGKIYLKLDNIPQAYGYFRIVEDNYPDYTGMPQVLYELGKIYLVNNNLPPAIAKFNKIISQYEGSGYLLDAQIELGMALYKNNSFIDALKILTPIVEENPRRIYESPDLLLTIGNAHYSLGQSAKARETLIKAYNMFPDIQDKDIILTRIGDSYINEKKVDKAIKIYRLVREQFPGTDGFVISTMRLAEYIENRQEKQALYNTVIEDYSENSLAKLARLRLAEIQNKAGEYENSIDTIKGLLKIGPENLRRDALYLLKESFKSLFKKFLGIDSYPLVLKNFEADKTIIGKFEDPELFSIIGKSYKEAHLYQQAIPMYRRAYRFFDYEERKEDFLLSFALCLKETGAFDESLDMINQYINRFSNSKDISKAYTLKGNIFLSQNKYKDAVDVFQTAYKVSGSEFEKGMILMAQADGYERMGEHQRAGKLLMDTVNHFITDPGDNFEEISSAYRELGKIHQELSSYINAVDSFLMALKFADKSQNNADLYFMLAESYQKGNILDKAVKSYNDVIATEDPFWSRLAQERVSSIKLDAKLKLI